MDPVHTLRKIGRPFGLPGLPDRGDEQIGAVEIGILDGIGPGIVLDLLRQEDGLVVGDNEPYFVSDLTDYTIPVHGEKRSLPHVEVEIRQDLITEERGQREWADRFIRLLPEALKLLNAKG